MFPINAISAKNLVIAGNPSNKNWIAIKIPTIPTVSAVQFQAYLDTPDTAPGFYYNVTNSDATSRFGWILAANDRSNLNRRRGSTT